MTTLKSMNQGGEAITWNDATMGEPPARQAAIERFSSDFLKTGASSFFGTDPHDNSKLFFLSNGQAAAGGGGAAAGGGGAAGASHWLLECHDELQSKWAPDDSPGVTISSLACTLFFALQFIKVRASSVCATHTSTAPPCTHTHTHRTAHGLS